MIFGWLNWFKSNLNQPYESFEFMQNIRIQINRRELPRGAAFKILSFYIGLVGFNS